MAVAFGKNLSEIDFTGRDTQVSERYCFPSIINSLFWASFYSPELTILCTMVSSSRDELEQSKQMGSQETDAAVGDIATKTIGEGNLDILDSKTYEEAEKSQHPLDDELADSDEDTEPVTITQENSAVRRQRRMVVDFEDD